MSNLEFKIEEEADILYFKWIAKRLKRKFKDKRTIPQLVEIIKEEYCIA